MSFGIINPPNEQRGIITDLGQFSQKISTIDRVDNIALVIVDPLRSECDPSHFLGNIETDAAARRIQSLSETFRKAAIDVFVVYTSHSHQDPNQIDFFHFTPQSSDIPVRKTKNSGFDRTSLHSSLQHQNKKRLLVCGFNLSACVKETALDALQLKCYDVTVVLDLCADNNDCKGYSKQTLHTLQQAGACIATSSDVFKELKIR